MSCTLPREKRLADRLNGLSAPPFDARERCHSLHLNAEVRARRQENRWLERLTGGYLLYVC
ncbi:hypothetical protein ECNG_05208 [Escherichia coli TA280]|nr:hypothetical protein ECNG_05208 [Escherichia coli TA280]